MVMAQMHVVVRAHTRLRPVVGHGQRCRPLSDLDPGERDTPYGRRGEWAGRRGTSWLFVGRWVLVLGPLEGLHQLRRVVITDKVRLRRGGSERGCMRFEDGRGNCNICHGHFDRYRSFAMAHGGGKLKWSWQIRILKKEKKKKNRINYD